MDKTMSVGEKSEEKLVFKSAIDFARNLDRQDPLSSFKDQFIFPKDSKGKPLTYFAGNSLGLQPKGVKENVVHELQEWATRGVEGHFDAKYPWYSYHENLVEQTACLVGANPIEVVVMNTLSVNLHLMMVSFYRPKRTRHKILIEAGSFPSDRYAVCSQIKFHGYDPREALIELRPRAGEKTLRTEDILETIRSQGEQIALVMLGNVNFFTGQAFDVQKITQASHEMGCRVGFDLAHGAGNCEFQLHDDGPDFAIWCSYKYLNAGPGSLSGCFIHERHARAFDVPRFAGWWGHNKQKRFEMSPQFEPMEGAEGWQLSNPPILEMAALRASMSLFEQATMPALRKKSEKLTGYLEHLIQDLDTGAISQVTPSAASERGAQLSFIIEHGIEELSQSLKNNGIVCDTRKPNVIRIAPVPLYNSFEDVFRLYEVLKKEVLKR